MSLSPFRLGNLAWLNYLLVSVCRGPARQSSETGTLFVSPEKEADEIKLITLLHIELRLKMAI